ncbi:hypothetical protein BCR39DRAFT_553965 [Naematelia encephala]|uniref:Beta-lactamase-like protein n=1 Tax=Naematelia encephala TaxID=71784 RepID=A0A1Y2AFD2_9TREE|nr:hypothetical protein BCR39DRAFT_553965 [Naematelia encephala]
MSTPNTIEQSSFSIPEILSASTDERDKTISIKQVTPDIITFGLPFSRAGLVPLGGRTTAIRVDQADSPVFIYVSHPLTSATKDAISKLGGEVKWLVTPDGEHGMYIEEYTKAYPNAKPIGVSRFKEKKPNVNWAGLFGAGGESQQYGFEPHITLHQVSAHANDELLAIHHPSGTLVEADMLFNLPPTEQYARAGGIPTLFKLFGSGKSMSPGGYLHTQMASAIAKDKELLKKELLPIQQAKWDRIIPCHGDIIETKGKAAWDQVWAKYASL